LALIPADSPLSASLRLSPPSAERAKRHLPSRRCAPTIRWVTHFSALPGGCSGPLRVRSGRLAAPNGSRLAPHRFWASGIIQVKGICSRVERRATP
jgi:hypothetical protein